VEVDLVEGRLPSKAELAAISRELRKDRTGFPKFYVTFWLAASRHRGSAFATADQVPDLVVKYLSLPQRYAHLARPEDGFTLYGAAPMVGEECRQGGTGVAGPGSEGRRHRPPGVAAR
jgi:hypothetical protein